MKMVVVVEKAEVGSFCLQTLCRICRVIKCLFLALQECTMHSVDGSGSSPLDVSECRFLPLPTPFIWLQAAKPQLVTLRLHSIFHCV